MARQWLGSGVLRGLYSELASAYAAGTITTQAGAVWIDGHYAELTSPATTPATANGLLVVRFTPADGKFELLYRDGVTVPTQTTATWELPVGQMVAGALVDVRPFAGPGGGIGGLTKIAEARALAAAAPNFDFQNIPANFRHLLMVVSARSDTAALATALFHRFNNDSAANYDSQLLYHQATAVSALEIFGAVQAQPHNDIPAASAPAGVFGEYVVLAPSASGAGHKSLIGLGGRLVGTATQNHQGSSGHTRWRSTAVVSRWTVFPQAGNFVVGSVATLYGL